VGRAELHDRAATELLLDREDRRVHGAPALGDRLVRGSAVAGVHVLAGDRHRVLAPGGVSRSDGAGPGPRPWRDVSPRRTPRPSAACAASGSAPPAAAGSDTADALDWAQC